MIPKHTIHIQNIFKNNVKQKKLRNLTTTHTLKRKINAVHNGKNKQYTCVHMQSTNSNYRKGTLILIFLKKYNPQTILNKREFSSQNKYKAVHKVYT